MMDNRTFVVCISALARTPNTTPLKTAPSHLAIYLKDSGRYTVDYSFMWQGLEFACRVADRDSDLPSWRREQLSNLIGREIEVMLRARYRVLEMTQKYGLTAYHYEHMIAPVYGEVSDWCRAPKLSIPLYLLDEIRGKSDNPVGGQEEAWLMSGMRYVTNPGYRSNPAYRSKVDSADSAGPCAVRLLKMEAVDRALADIDENWDNDSKRRFLWLWLTGWGGIWS